MLTAREPLRLIRTEGFRRLYLTRLGGQLTDGVFQVALASYVLFNPEKATTAGAAAQLFAVLLLPFSVVGPFAGVLLDRWRRQRLLVVANVVRAGLVCLVAVLVAADVANPAFYVSALAVLSVNRFVLAGLSASLPHVVDRDDLVLANSVSTTSGTLTAGLGGALGYAVDLASGRSWVVLVVAAGGYLGSALLAGRVGREQLGPDFDAEPIETREALRRVLRGLADGARHVWSHPRAGSALAAIAAHRFFYGISTISTLLLYRNYFNDADAADAALGGFAVVIAASGVGVAVAAVITPAMTRRLGAERWVVTLFAGAAAVEVVFGFPYREPLFVVAALGLGLVAQGSKICVDTLVQRSVDQAYRGRVFAFYDVMFNVAFVAAAAVGALLIPTSGKSYVVLTVIAVGYAATAAGYLAVSRSRPVEAATSGVEQAADDRQQPALPG